MFKSSQFIMIISSLFFSSFYNDLFWKKVAAVYPFGSENIWYFISLFMVLTTVIYTVLNLINFKYTLKPALIILFMITASASYFMNSYGVVIDSKMINNLFETQTAEARDLLSLKLFLDLFLFGILPSIVIYFSKIEYKTFGKHLLIKLLGIIVAFLVLVTNLYVFSRFYSSFFREHKPIRYYTNPTYYLYSSGKYINSKYQNHNIIVQKTGLDAKLTEGKKPKLLILVVGESARADHFSLNGYKKDTNPNLQKENVIDFKNMYSCGTETATSVPCMFSVLDRSDFSIKKALEHENVLDVAKRAGVRIKWIDNNSDSKGVATRIKDVVNIRNKKIENFCDNGECRDEALLVGLQKYLDKNVTDTIVVLHQMGNHGPAYYKRYPKRFEKFKPVCKSNQLQECSQESIANAYDNAILYTDYFLSKTIDILKNNTKKYDTAFLYMSDHGESLGEKGVYLHAMPYFIAPVAQRHVGSVAWFGKDFDHLDINCVRKNANKEYSQDDYFSTVLGLMDIKTKVYDKKKDIFAQCRKN
ncbi:MAG: phosphoethanolamine--lipid A transferase [Epsilonproteobacteria bacterium]|nr:phosphoethanolamine--lipid A transferase [Campylobacterota bacterium]